jgi:uncharacterized protein DUF2442
MITHRTSVRVTSVTATDGFILRVGFDDGTEREVNLEDELWGPVFKPLREDPALFRQARVEEVLGTVVWPNGADLDPEVLQSDYLPADSSAKP